MLAQPFKLTPLVGVPIHGLFFSADQPIANVVITTGMEEYSARYNDFATYLVSLGYNVTVLDHYGQGLTASKNNLPYGIVPRDWFNKFISNLNEVIVAKRREGLPVYLLGFSMGSFVTQRYVQLHSDTIDKAVIMGSNGPDFAFKAGNILAKLTVNKHNWDKKAKLFNAMAFGTYAKSVKHPKTKVDSTLSEEEKRFNERVKELAWLSYDEENVKTYVRAEACGYGSTKGFYYEFMGTLHKLHSKKAMDNVRKDFPILLIAGVDDPVGHMGKGIKKLTAYYEKHGLNNVTEVIIPKMRHEILNEADKQLVYEDIASFLAMGKVKNYPSNK